MQTAVLELGQYNYKPSLCTLRTTQESTLTVIPFIGSHWCAYHFHNTRTCIRTRTRTHTHTHTHTRKHARIKTRARAHTGATPPRGRGAPAPAPHSAHGRCGLPLALDGKTDCARCATTAGCYLMLPCDGDGGWRDW